MTNEDKIALADSFIRMVQSFSTSEDMPVMVGTLNKAQGINGFEVAEIGHPVFEFKQRYVIYLKNSLTTVAVPYYKDSLKLVINFL